MAHFFPISVEVRFLRIPTWWTCRDSQWGRTAVPEIDQDEERQLTVIHEPWEIRNEFLRLSTGRILNDEKRERRAMEFLNKIGVWKAIKDPGVTAAKAGTMMLAGPFGHQLFFGRALPIPLGEFWEKLAFWKELLSPASRERLRAMFSTPPPEDAALFQKVDFAAKSEFLNSQSLHLEWQMQTRKQEDGRITEAVEPRGVIEAITFWELLEATTHMDLMRDADFQVCQRPDCAIPFTGRERQYCSQYCGHLESIRSNRQKEKEKMKHGKRR